MFDDSLENESYSEFSEIAPRLWLRFEPPRPRPPRVDDETARRTCIFCGARNPLDRNKEHIIPKWLFEGPSAIAPVKRKPVTYLTIRGQRLPLSNFEFPACSACNSQWSDVENAAKGVMQTLLLNQSITTDQTDMLLDWFDKIRVGLSLGGLKLTKNETGINPNHHINSRVRLADRLLFILQQDVGRPVLALSPPDDPLFQFHPSFLFLRVNHLWFFNYSEMGCASNTLGLREVISTDTRCAGTDVLYECGPPRKALVMRWRRLSQVIAASSFNPSCP
jgi:hypothetical protein